MGSPSLLVVFAICGVIAAMATSSGLGPNRPATERGARLDPPGKRAKVSSSSSSSLASLPPDLVVEIAIRMPTRDVVQASRAHRSLHDALRDVIDRRLFDRVWRSFRFDRRLPDLVAELCVRRRRRDRDALRALFRQIDDDHLVLLCDRLRAVSKTAPDVVVGRLPRRLRRRFAAVADRIQNVHRFEIPTDSPVVAGFLRDHLGVAVPDLDPDHSLRMHDLVTLLVGVRKSELLYDRAVLAAGLRCRLRLPLVDVLYSAGVPPAGLDPVLPYYASFWPAWSDGVDWAFLTSLRRLRRAHSRTSLADFWRLEAVRERFDRRQIPDLIRNIVRAGDGGDDDDPLALLIDVQFPYLNDLLAPPYGRDLLAALLRAGQYGRVESLLVRCPVGSGRESLAACLNADGPSRLDTAELRRRRPALAAILLRGSGPRSRPAQIAPSPPPPMMIGGGGDSDSCGDEIGAFSEKY